MYEMQTIVTDVNGIRLSVCLSRCSTKRRMQCVQGIRCSLCQITLASWFTAAHPKFCTSAMSVGLQIIYSSTVTRYRPLWDVTIAGSPRCPVWCRLVTVSTDPFTIHVYWPNRPISV